MHVHPPCEQHCSSHILSRSNDYVHMLDASVPFPATTVPIELMDEEVKSSEPNDNAGKRTTGALSQNHLSCLCKIGWSNVIAMQDHPHLLRCSAAYRMHIVDWLLGSMFMNGSGRTADLLCAEVMLCILLIYPLQPG